MPEDIGSAGCWMQHADFVYEYDVCPFGTITVTTGSGTALLEPTCPEAIMTCSSFGWHTWMNQNAGSETTFHRMFDSFISCAVFTRNEKVACV